MKACYTAFWFCSTSACSAFASRLPKKTNITSKPHFRMNPATNAFLPRLAYQNILVKMLRAESFAINVFQEPWPPSNHDEDIYGIHLGAERRRQHVEEEKR